MFKSNVNNLTQLKYGKYIFPLLIFLSLVGLTLFKISGSSIGPYYDFLFNQSNHSLLFNNLRGVRTDEWLINTQFTLAQEAAGYPRINNNIGYNGTDMSIITDVPYKEWSTLFKPQNWSFFILPFENAFAFKWWSMLAASLLTIYAFSLKFLKHQYLKSALIAVIFSFTPLIFWWYQAATIMSVVWAVVICILIIKFLREEQIKVGKRVLNITYSRLLLLLALSYSLISFALLLYPAFQIPLAIVCAFFCIGYCIKLSSDKKQNLRELFQVLWPVLIALFISTIVVGIFIATRLDSIRTITSTVYPGSRDIPAGMIGPQQMLNMLPEVQYKLQDDKVQATLPNNQSEASSFVLLSIPLLIPTLYYLFAYFKRERRLEWTLLSIVFANLILIGHFAVPIFEPVSRLLFLSEVPAIRLYMGFGLLGLFTLVYLISMMQSFEFSKTKSIILMITYAFIIVFGYTLLAKYLQQSYPSFIGPIRNLLPLILLMSLGIILMFHKSTNLIGLIIISVFSVVSVLRVQPLYIGMSDVLTMKLFPVIKSYPANETWAFNGDYTLENVITAAGRKSITGVSPYPDLNFWQDMVGIKNENIYNRYAHVMLAVGQNKHIQLVQSDVFKVRLQCGDKLNGVVDKILSTEKINLSCYKIASQTSIGEKQIYVYSKSNLN